MTVDPPGGRPPRYLPSFTILLSKPNHGSRKPGGQQQTHRATFRAAQNKFDVNVAALVAAHKETPDKIFAILKQKKDTFMAKWRAEREQDRRNHRAAAMRAAGHVIDNLEDMERAEDLERVLNMDLDALDELDALELQEEEEVALEVPEEDNEDEDEDAEHIQDIIADMAHDLTEIPASNIQAALNIVNDVQIMEQLEDLDVDNFNNALANILQPTNGPSSSAATTQPPTTTSSTPTSNFGNQRIAPRPPIPLQFMIPPPPPPVQRQFPNPLLHVRPIEPVQSRSLASTALPSASIPSASLLSKSTPILLPSPSASILTSSTPAPASSLPLVSTLSASSTSLPAASLSSLSSSSSSLLEAVVAEIDTSSQIPISNSIQMTPSELPAHTTLTTQKSKIARKNIRKRLNKLIKKDTSTNDDIPR